MAERLTIERLGALGDGIAQTPTGRIYVPFSLPGETITAEVNGERGRLLSVEKASPARRDPISPFFTRCGGCVAQHMDEECYRRWKEEIVATALARGGIETPIDPLIDAHGAGRRRVVLHARTVEGAMRVGFMAAQSHTLVAIDRCPILSRELAEAPSVALALARLLQRSGKPIDIQLTASLEGLDVDIRGHGPVSADENERLVETAAKLDLARLSLHGDVLVERRSPSIAIGLARVVPPPGGFLQPTVRGEEVLAGLVAQGTAKARAVLDLFAGCGPTALRLAQRSKVHAVDSDGLAIAALDHAARHALRLKPLSTERRDLFRRPLLPAEIDLFEAVVFDPPRVGAEAQARQIAASRIAVAIAVSCNVTTFVRDANILLGGGFALKRVTPVDQFRFAAHVEVVGLFERAGKPPRSAARGRG